MGGQRQYKRALSAAARRGREKRLTTLSYTGPKEPERYSTNSKIFNQPQSPSTFLKAHQRFPHMPLPTHTTYSEQFTYIALCLTEGIKIISEKLFDKKNSENLLDPRKK